MPKIDESLEFIPVRIAVLAVSDSRSMADDVSGETLVSMIGAAGHIVADTLQAWVDSDDVDVVISTGGTGLTGRDVSVEAHRDVYEKEIEAFATMFTIVSMKNVGTSAVQSRATGGIAKSTYLFALPGSPGACKDAWNEILIWQLDHRHRPSNFVQMMPRLEEHKRPR